MVEYSNIVRIQHMPGEFEIANISQKMKVQFCSNTRRMGGGPTGKRDEAFWRWKHFQNPFGPSISLVAVSSSGKIIGLRHLCVGVFSRKYHGLRL